MPSGTREDYLKALYVLEQADDGALVPMGRLAQVVGITAGTATAMVKSLDRSGLLVYQPRQGVRLTDAGRNVAIGVLRRHRLVELFLVQHLGLNWAEVDQEAERLEHAISDRVLDCLDAFMGFPSYDPHGDPIPDAMGRMRERSLTPLSTCMAGASLRVAQVNDHDGDFLLFVEKASLKPGRQVHVHARDDQAQTMTIVPEDHAPLTLAMASATRILVELVQD